MWSTIVAKQVIARVLRQGQIHPVYAFQLMLPYTVDSLLIRRGLGKSMLLNKFFEVIDVQGVYLVSLNLAQQLLTLLIRYSRYNPTG